MKTFSDYLKPPLLLSALCIVALTGCRNRAHTGPSKAKKAAIALKPPTKTAKPHDTPTKKPHDPSPPPSPPTPHAGSKSVPPADPATTSSESATPPNASLSAADIAKVPAALQQYAKAIVEGTIDINHRIDYYEGYRSTILHILVYEKADAAVVQKFLDAGADYNQIEEKIETVSKKTGDAPLHLALRPDYTAVMTALLQCPHIAVDAQDAEGYTALQRAVQKNMPTTVEALLKAKANVNVRHGGNTPLHRATSNNYQEIVKILLRHSADPDVTNAQGQTALHIATEQGNLAMVRTLLSDANAQKANPDATNRQGQTALHIAAKEGHTEIAQQLLKHSANVNAQDVHGITPLWAATYPSPNTQMIALLSKHKADPRIGQITINDKAYTLREALSMHTRQHEVVVKDSPEEDIEEESISRGEASPAHTPEPEKGDSVPPFLDRGGAVLPLHLWNLTQDSVIPSKVW